jgi:hypothetical protein
MMRALILGACCALLLAACTGGSSTTLRPAADKPIIEPDGTFWDAVEAARSSKPQRLRVLLSTDFVHRAILPNVQRDEATDDEEYTLAVTRMERELLPFVSIREKLYARYASWLEEFTRGKVIETGVPAYDIKYRDGFGSASGPNIAMVKVSLHSPKIKEPQEFTVKFIQVGDAWRIDGFKPDPLFGEFIR